MDVRAVFGLSVLISFAAFGLVTALSIWPRLRTLRRDDALVPLMAAHAFRFVGLSFLVPGVVSASLPPAFAIPAALGDMVAALLAIAATLAVIRRASWALGLVWLFNVWGTVDLLYAFYQGLGSPGFNPGAFGAAFFIPTAIVPPLLVTHGLIFRLLVRAPHGDGGRSAEVFAAAR